MIHFVVPAAQDFLMRDYLACWGRELAGRMKIVHYEALAAAAELDGGTYVLSALDQLGPSLAGFARELHERFAGSEGFRFLNHPARTLQRRALLAELHRRGLNSFRAVLATDDLSALRYPVFMRGESTHDGALTPLLPSARELDVGLGLVAVRGRPLSEVLVVEFCPTADADGYYRKYSAFVVGGRVVPRSLAYGRSWMLKHEGTLYSRSVVEEELHYVRTNPHRVQLEEIFAIAGVGYGRIDYSLLDGGVQTWEINLNPTIGRGLRPPSGRVPPELEPIRSETKAHFYDGFRAAWEAVDLPASSRVPFAHPPVPLARRPGQIGSLLRRGVLRAVATARGAIIPADPLRTPRYLPLLGRLARLRATR
ncbi:MAG TPA: hypothetical protein VK420_12825 [Longimicrobium sp.]|nr:hypothetical protein [Longimicrobium sp.]